MDDTLHRERDRLPFAQTSAQTLNKLIGALHAEKFEVRRYEKAFLHAKAYIVSAKDQSSGNPRGVIVGSSNLTSAGLTRNLELNLGRYDQAVEEQASRWFDELWHEATPYDLAKVFEDALKLYSPWEIFMRVLWKLYGDEVEEDIRVDNNLPLTSFQRHGVARAQRLIHEVGGVIVADEVGLGKTFIAGDILKRYQARRQRALLICPASLRDSTWKQFLVEYHISVECLSFEELANDRQLQEDDQTDFPQHLLRHLSEYQLVIVDEAHNYRNPGAPARSGTLRRLMFGQQRHLLLLTATPVNNSLWDLYHLLSYFLRQDAHFADRGILSIKTLFNEAMREDPSALSPDILYPIIDATTVKRTRQFVKKHYAGDTINGPDGPRTIVFPKPNAISVRYRLDDLMPGFFDRLEQALEPDGTEAIIFARYMPDIYLLKDAEEEESARANALTGLLRSGLLKRFESSVFAFSKTVEKMIREHGVFLEALSTGRVITTAFLQELSADDDTAFESLLLVTEDREDAERYNKDATLYDVVRMQKAVERDRDLLQALWDEAKTITPDQDPKLQVLVNELDDIVKQADSEAVDTYDERQKRKVLIFSFFEDTVRWIQRFLSQTVRNDSSLSVYQNRIAMVSGSGNLSDVSKEKAALGFAPISMQSRCGKKDDRYDLLISTDVLAEGINLQQCRHIINFDMPWNPMRLVQRHGRIDRIGSEYKQVFLRTVFPVDRLDRLLNLEQRILKKLAMAAASVGVEPPIEDAAHGTQVFADTREEIEKLMAEDNSLFEHGVTASATQTGEEYRQALRKTLKTSGKRISSLPWKAGSGMKKGERRGFIFCAVVGRDSDKERTYLRFIAADENWQPATENGSVEKEIGTCLRFLECSEDTPSYCPELLQEQAYIFWEKAQSDILNDWMKQTDPANLQPKVRPLNNRVAEFIRKNPPLDMLEERINEALDILESPWSRREESMLRSWFETDEHQGSERSSILIEKIIGTGLEPAKPPPLLPPIDLQDIELLCWMSIESKS